MGRNRKMNSDLLRGSEETMLQNDGTQHWSLSRNFFDSVVTDERKLSNLENIQDDGSVDTLLNLFDANEAIKAAWNAH